MLCIYVNICICPDSCIYPGVLVLDTRMLTYAHVCSRMLTYAYVCFGLLTYADVC
jgi:hypothetical protein